MSALSMSAETKYMLFMFLGLIVAILILGFHRSPQASASLGATQLSTRQVGAPAPFSIAPVSTEQYEEEEEY